MEKNKRPSLHKMSEHLFAAMREGVNDEPSAQNKIGRLLRDGPQGQRPPVHKPASARIDRDDVIKGQQCLPISDRINLCEYD